VTLLDPVPTAPRPGMTAILPVNHWRNENDFMDAVPVRKPYQFLSPDGTTFIPAGQDFVTGELYYGSKLHDVLRAFGMAPAVAGQPFYVSDESEEKTYKADLGDDGTISTLKLFAEQGGESVAVDTEGNVYIAAGNIFVYDPAGHLIDTIEVPERPLQLVFGGKDGHTLFVLTHTSLYSIETRTKGQRTGSAGLPEN